MSGVAVMLSSNADNLNLRFQSNSVVKPNSNSQSDRTLTRRFAGQHFHCDVIHREFSAPANKHVARQCFSPPASMAFSIHSFHLFPYCHVRIKGVSPKVMKVIQMMRLRMIFSGAFIKVNKTSVAMMKMVEPYVAWG